jgi:hypothetical protein
MACAVGAAIASRGGPKHWYGRTLVANVLLFNGVGALLPTDFGPGLNLLSEFMLFEVAAVSSIVVNGRMAMFLALMFISVISITVSTSQALSLWPFGNYEVVVNVLFLAECAVLGRRGIANVIGRVYDVVRSRSILRHPMDDGAVSGHGVVAPAARGSERHDDSAKHSL